MDGGIICIDLKFSIVIIWNFIQYMLHGVYLNSASADGPIYSRTSSLHDITKQ